MTLREHQFGVEIVASLIELGRLANRAILAIHRAASGLLEDDDRDALDAGQQLLVQLQSVAGVTLPAQSLLRTMRPISMLEETLRAVSRATPHADTRAHLTMLIESLESIKQGRGTSPELQSVAALFEDLRTATLSRTRSLARRGPERIQGWMSEALSSSGV